MRLLFIIPLTIFALLAAYSASYGADVKKYLFIPSIQIVEYNDYIAFQVKQRVIIRLRRTRQDGRASFSDFGNSKRPKVKFEEQIVGKCIAVDEIIGFAPGPDASESLEFLTKDQKIIRAYLADNCRAREFYAGAYIEKSKDGKLCRKRDIIHARYGAKCELDRFRLLVPETS